MGFFGGIHTFGRALTSWNGGADGIPSLSLVCLGVMSLKNKLGVETGKEYSHPHVVVFQWAPEYLSFKSLHPSTMF